MCLFYLICVGGGEGEEFAFGVPSMQQFLLWLHSLVVPGQAFLLFIAKKKVFFYQNRLTDMSTVMSWVTSLNWTRLRIFTEA